MIPHLSMKRLPRFLLISGLVALALLLYCEIILRLFWQMSGLKGELYRRSANSILRYELKPGARLNIPGHFEDIRINSDGFRGPDYPFTKGPGVFRIVMIGDSVTFSRLLKFEDCLTQRLETMLEASCPGRDFEVLNMGVEGYNSFQELEVLKTKAFKYQPDLVVVYYCLNDPDYPEYFFKKNFLNRHSLLARYLLYRSKKHRIKEDRRRRGIKSDVDAYSYFYSTDCWPQARDAVLEMARLTQVRGVRLVLLIVPEMSLAVKDFRGGYPFWQINEMIEGLSHENMTVIDPLREFSRRDLKKEDLTVWTYPNLTANNVIAEYAIRILREKGLVPCS